MAVMNMLEAKTNLSRLVESIESGTEKEIVLARNGKPVARIIPLAQGSGAQLLGVAHGCLTFDKEAFDAADTDIADMFGTSDVGEPVRV